MKKISITTFSLLLAFCILGGSGQKMTQAKYSMEGIGNKVKGTMFGSILPFPIDKQPALNLCWAQVTANVSKFYDSGSVYQVCDLANYALNMSNCCGNIGPCDSSWYLGRALSYTQNLKAANAGVPTLDVIENQITNGYVVCLRIEWRGTNCGSSPCGHFIVIYGFTSDNKLYIYDPWPTSSPPVSSFDDIALFYQSVGQITDYYLTKKATDL